MIDCTKLSTIYSVRPLTETDIDTIFALCQSNPLFYQYAQAEPTREQIELDMRITPPDFPLSGKYYLGFFHGADLVAVMDLLDGYPDAETAFIGFFMMHGAWQGRNVGSGIIADVAAALRAAGMTRMQLGIDKGNPQSTHFWKKNGFVVTDEVDRDGHIILLAERPL